MSARIGGPLDVMVMARLAGGDAPRRAFRLLTRDAQAAAVRRMSRDGRGDHEIADATGLDVAFLRQILGKRESAA